MTTQEQNFKAMANRELIAAANLLTELANTPINRQGFDRSFGFEIRFNQNTGDVYLENQEGETFGLLEEEE